MRHLRQSDGNFAARPLRELDGGVGDVGRVDKRYEPGELLRILEDALPLARITLDVAGDGRLEFVGEAKGVVADDIAQMVQSTLEGC